MKMVPVVFNWLPVEVIDAESGEARRVMAMVPQPRYHNVAARQFTADHEYPLVILEARSRASHSHFFAALQSGFDSLPEKIAARWPTSEHLRKWLLVESGWFNESEIDCASAGHAKQVAVLVRSFDEYARISVHGPKVIIRRAKSQSAAAMGKEEFQKSKSDCLELLEHLTDVPKGALMKNAGRSG